MTDEESIVIVLETDTDRQPEDEDMSQMVHLDGLDSLEPLEPIEVLSEDPNPKIKSRNKRKKSKSDGNQEGEDDNDTSATGIILRRNYYKRPPKGKPISGQTKQIVLNVFCQVIDKKLAAKKNGALKLTAELTGVSVRSILRIKTEAVKFDGKLETAGKTRPRAQGKKLRVKKFDSSVLLAIRRKIHSFIVRKEHPTLGKLYVECNKDQCIPNVKRSTLRRLIEDLGFLFRKRQKDMFIVERGDIVAWRRKYLRDIRKFRQERAIYYLGETRIPIASSNKLITEDMNRSTVTNKHTGLVIMFACGVMGFVPNSLKISEVEMDSHNFQKWFEECLLPSLEPRSIIVMDNAPYNSSSSEHVPEVSWSRRDIQKWLNSKGIVWQKDMVKAELLEIVKSVKGSYSTQGVGELTDQHGHTILRPPPYHYELNPLSGFWRIVQDRVNGIGRDLLVEEGKRLVELTIQETTLESWLHLIQLAIMEENMLWETDKISDILMDKIVSDSVEVRPAGVRPNNVEPGLEQDSSDDGSGCRLTVL